jgi:hypothetical protein
MRIKAAAICTEENEVWSVPAPGRHHNVIWLMRDMGFSVGRIAYSEEGFITDSDEFVSRTEAMIIAKAAGQLIDKHYEVSQHYTELYSEWVW